MFVILLVVTIILFFFGVPESPKWLFTKKRFDEAKEVIKKVASFNSVPEPNIKFTAELGNGSQEDGNASIVEY